MKREATRIEPVYRVLPRPQGWWAVEREGAGRAIRRFASRDDAIAYARTIARRMGASVVAPPEGYGALRGAFVVRDGIDLTKPIYEQVARLRRQG